MKRIIFRRLVIGLTATGMMLGNAVINTADDVALSGKAMSVAEYLQSIRFGVKEAEAGSNMLEWEKVSKAIPSALKNAHDRALTSAYMHFKVSGRTNNCENYIYAKNILDIERSYENCSTHILINSETPGVSHLYHLLVYRFGDPKKLKQINAEIKNSNRQLFEFSEGVFEMYEGIERNNPQSRKYYGPVPGYYRVAVEHFTNGLFLAAELGPNEFSSLGINYQPAMDMAGNAFEMAKVFREASLQGKIRILDVVKDKFKNVKFKEDAQTRPDSIEYDMESVYWNLGFYLITEFARQNQNIANKLAREPKGLYQTLKKGFNYPIISQGLFGHAFW